MKKLIAVLALVFSTSVFAQTVAGWAQPNEKLSPGAIREATVKELCTTSTKEVRNKIYTESQKRAEIYPEYNLKPKTDPKCTGPGHSCYEIDHRVPLKLGGADERDNLWIQPYDGVWNAHYKDKLEFYLSNQVCAGKIPLKEAQDVFLGDWTKGYTKYFGSKIQ